MKNQPERIEEKATNWQPSETLQNLLAKLTKQQAAAIVRVAEADVAGIGITDLLRGPNKICNKATYYGKWYKREAFQEALLLALVEVRTLDFSDVVTQAREELKRTTPLAVADLQRQIVGDDGAVESLAAILRDGSSALADQRAAAIALGTIGTKRSTQALIAVLNKCLPDARETVLLSIGVSGAGTSTQRRMASIAVLDRADPETADKSGHKAAEELTDDELAAIAARDVSASGAGIAATQTSAPDHH
jgi:hypothetical protein